MIESVSSSVQKQFGDTRQFYLKLLSVAFDFRVDYNTQMYNSTHFYMYVSEHK